MTDTSRPMSARKRWDFCPTCGVYREAVVNDFTGEAWIAMNSCCPHPRQCEQQIMPGFEPKEQKRDATT